MTEATHEQAQLLLQVYDLRREAKLRIARTWVLNNFWAESLEEMELVAPTGSDQNAYMRQVASYWDMACMFLNHGLLNREQFFANSGEFYMVWTRLQPLAELFRKAYKNPTFFKEMETAAAEYEKYCQQSAPGYLEVRQSFAQQAREAGRAAMLSRKAPKKKTAKKTKQAKKKAGKKRKAGKNKSKKKRR